MAEKLVATIKRWQGLHSDDKPLVSATSTVPEGATFHAIDTGEKWIHFNGMWERDGNEELETQIM
jgi:hypothetical protein